jgi:hypothetical protein
MKCSRAQKQTRLQLRSRESKLTSRNGQSECSSGLEGIHAYKAAGSFKLETSGSWNCPRRSTPKASKDEDAKQMTRHVRITKACENAV